jgi:hypothetical protein
MPYFEMSDLPDDLASLKITEAIIILRTVDKTVDQVWQTLEEPGK